ncbi:MAG TPA: methionyl-tRNA formyltransferase [Acidobacteriota bacterium]|nr:methionyl-tRNA formyltransferase [Acidobacteriota bacterium]HOT00732.1 methionyl-tRNA formyltransferase [Acidobacteriota bacterium]HQF85723.1 methionyl-tRNA formyltransferase [Acidobacteriota bacterium]HQG91033.1 methionyl-tRNA formyltransferase [Acidobacteriota bacterium]
MRIAFMGSSEFSVTSLAALVDTGETVAAVITQPDRPAGRGLRVTPSPVKQFATAQGLPVFQYASMKSAEAHAGLVALQPDLLVVAAYGQILPQRILDVPRIAPLNVHASLLPRYRGAAPIAWAILQGETRTGVSIMRIVRRLDAGDVLVQRPEPIRPDDTAATLHDRLKELGARCLLEALELIRAGRATYTPQDESAATYAPSLGREMARLDWTQPARETLNRIRGLNPWPVAQTTFRGQTCKIWLAEPAEAPDGDSRTVQPGRLRLAGRRLAVQAGDGAWLHLLELQLPGRAAVDGEAFARGARIAEGDAFA